MSFIQNKDLGFDKENIVIVSAESNKVRSHIDAFRNSLKRNPRIKSAAISSNVPGDKVFFDTMFKRDDTGDVFNLTIMDAGWEFANTYKLEMAAGRWYSKEFGTDLQNAFILNEKAIKDIGWQLEEAVGKKITMTVGENKSRPGTVIGVVKDFNLQSLHYRIEPLAILPQPIESIRYISLRILPGDIRETVEFIKEKWKNTFPGEQFQYSFQDDKINLLYKKDESTRDIVLIFSVLSIMIACLGLFGLAAYTAEDRTREIGVRKVFGASSGGIILLLSKEFSKWVGIAVIIAWPAAYYVMSRWLQDFAFRTDIGIGSFILAGILAFAIAQLTVGYQSVKAANANPVDSLRYE
jgi:putative ABC transport system permease protein